MWTVNCSDQHCRRGLPASKVTIKLYDKYLQKLRCVITLISSHISSEHILSPGGGMRTVQTVVQTVVQGVYMAVLVLLHYSYHCWLVPASSCHTCSGETTRYQSSVISSRAETTHKFIFGESPNWPVKERGKLESLYKLHCITGGVFGHCEG